MKKHQTNIIAVYIYLTLQKKRKYLTTHLPTSVKLILKVTLPMMDHEKLLDYLKL